MGQVAELGNGKFSAVILMRAAQPDGTTAPLALKVHSAVIHRYKPLPTVSVTFTYRYCSPSRS